MEHLICPLRLRRNFLDAEIALCQVIGGVFGLVIHGACTGWITETAPSNRKFSVDGNILGKCYLTQEPFATCGQGV